MTERTAFAPGVPCWVDTWQPDAATGAAFYAALMGWDTETATPEDSAPRYIVCRLDGRDVAAIGHGEGAPAGAAAPASAAAPTGAGAPASAGAAARAAPPPRAAPAAPAGAAAPAWTTYVQVADIDDTLAKASAAGGAVLAGPADSLDGGRIAIIRDAVGAPVGGGGPGAPGGRGGRERGRRVGHERPAHRRPG